MKKGVDKLEEIEEVGRAEEEGEIKGSIKKVIKVKRIKKKE